VILLKLLSDLLKLKKIEDFAYSASIWVTLNFPYIYRSSVVDPLEIKYQASVNNSTQRVVRVSYVIK